MEIQVIQKNVPSNDGIHTLRGKAYIPDAPIIGLFQVVHGMTEHIERYDGFMRKIASLGYVVFGYDHVGHGKTADNMSELGFFASKDGWKLLCQDVASFAEAMQTEYGEELPWVLMGHSMGSFVVRLTAVDFKKPDKLIIMGTGGPNRSAGLGLLLIKVLKKIKGEKSYSDLVEGMAFGSYNKRFSKENKYDWLTKDEEIKKAYAMDPFCTFRFTLSALGDLVTMNKNCNLDEWFDKAASLSGESMPILIVSGKDDPVGDYSKGVKEVYRKLKKRGANVVMRLYSDCRHEILNDTCRKEVASDIRVFLREF